MSKKRIVICADGTWNEPERIDARSGRPQPTNVLKTARAIRPRAKRDGIEQVVYYHEGVGTGGGMDSFSGGVFGTGVTDNVRALYRFLVYNYVDGDELFFFGFSRGAFTVRTLAGFMSCVGLLEKEDEYYTRELYALYESSIAPSSAQWQRAFRNIGRRRLCPPIRFVGVWDTVGALGGILNTDEHDYHDVDLNAHIENAYHALAIDERRKPFLPTLWRRPNDWSGQLEQVWFPGVHSNVGGGYSPDGLANEALHWMIEKAQALGLEFDEAFLAHYLPCFNSKLFDSMSLMYRVLGPKPRIIGAHRYDGESIHQSAIDRQALAALKYRPRNLEAAIKAQALPIVTTTRIARGAPCPPIQMRPRVVRNDQGEADDRYIN